MYHANEGILRCQTGGNPMGKTITFKRPDGKDVQGYLASPAGGDKTPGVVVVQDGGG